MFSFAKKGKATVIRYLVTVLRDRERRSFLHLLQVFFSRITVHFLLFNRKWGSRECPARVISDKIWPPFAAVKVSILYIRFFPVYVFIQVRIFLSSFILRKPQNLNKYQFYLTILSIIQKQLEDSS